MDKFFREYPVGVRISISLFEYIPERLPEQQSVGIDGYARYSVNVCLHMMRGILRGMPEQRWYHEEPSSSGRQKDGQGIF